MSDTLAEFNAQRAEGWQAEAMKWRDRAAKFAAEVVRLRRRLDELERRVAFDEGQQ